jgi:hypothetical protein
MLSAHDLDIIMLQKSLNLTNYECIYEKFHHLPSLNIQCEEYPGFASSLLFEFYEN